MNISRDSINAALSATLRVIASDKYGNKVEVRAMADGGSHMNMVSSRLVQLLKLRQAKLSIPLENAGRYSIPSKSIVNFEIRPVKNGSSTGEWIHAGVLNSISDRLPNRNFDISSWRHIRGLPLADTEFNVPADVDILLSVEFMARIQCKGLRKNWKNKDLPIATKTTFGWTVHGALPTSQTFASISHLSVADSQRMADSLEKLWQVDAVKTKPILTEEEELCTQMFSKSIIHADDGRYYVAMPFMQKPPKLGNSLRAAIARQLQNEKR